MDKFLNFLTNNYIIFIIISVFLLLALIGFLVDKFSKKNVSIDNSIPSVESEDNLNIEIVDMNSNSNAGNDTQILQENITTSQETGGVNLIQNEELEENNNLESL